MTLEVNQHFVNVFFSVDDDKPLLSKKNVVRKPTCNKMVVPKPRDDLSIH